MRKDEHRARQSEAAERYTISNLITAQQTPNFQQDGHIVINVALRTSRCAIRRRSSEFMYLDRQGSDCNVYIDDSKIPLVFGTWIGGFSYS
jgi:hypothetical protein